MSQNIKITKGANIKLNGVPEKVLGTAANPEVFAIKPSDFHGLVPKMAVKVGDEVKAGSVLFYDKYNEKIKYTSPVSGEVVEVVRGEKRRILTVKILADKEIRYEQFEQKDIANADASQIKELLLSGGLWPFIKQRPYDIVADPNKEPKGIFISTFDTNPLAADYDYVLHGGNEDFQVGLDAISKLTSGKVHLNVNSSTISTGIFSNLKNVQINQFSGPHPAGNVGVQIHHLDPMNKGEVAWVINPQDLHIIGRFLKTGKADFSKTIAFGGPRVEKPRYYKTIVGSSIKNILSDNTLIGDNNRIISGNPLTGEQIASDGFLGFYHNEISVLEEGNDYQFMGWLTPNLDKLSFSKSFFSWLTPNKSYSLNTNKNGEDRAYVMTGQYERFFPMDIYPVHLIKAMIVKDIDNMEKLGVYEVAPEDFALCEFACTSKVNVQDVVRKGLDLVKQECE